MFFSIKFILKGGEARLEGEVEAPLYHPLEEMLALIIIDNI